MNKILLWIVGSSLFKFAIGGCVAAQVGSIVKPQDNFYQFVNRGWLESHSVPPEFGYVGTITEIQNVIASELCAICEDADANHRQGGERKLVGDFFASGMDGIQIESAALKPIENELMRIGAIRDAASVAREIGYLHLQDVDVGFVFGVENDPGHGGIVIPSISQGGLALPNSSYYLLEDRQSRGILGLYREHIRRIFEIAKATPDGARDGADAVLKIETFLSKGAKTTAELREPAANTHYVSYRELQTLAPHFDWNCYCEAIKCAPFNYIDIRQTSFLERFDALCATISPKEWQYYLKWSLLHHYAKFLNASLVSEDFHFFGTILEGKIDIGDRRFRVIETLNKYVGDLLGRLYASAYCTPAVRTRARNLAFNIKAEFKERLEKNEWMDESTREQAERKLADMVLLIGYPDTWTNYAGLIVGRATYASNVQNAAEFAFRERIRAIGRSIDYSAWPVSPQTNDAFYDFRRNLIVVPAGILQMPLFNPYADDALNYGALGAIIGHEVTHGFDDQGRKFDYNGVVRDWWSETTTDRFSMRAAAVVRRFNDYVILDDLHVNGKMTLGENIADIAGLAIAFAAFEKNIARSSHTRAEKSADERRFFISYAVSLRLKLRPEVLRWLVLNGTHAPPELRVNSAVSDLPEFYTTFDVPAGAPMWRAPFERLRIW